MRVCVYVSVYVCMYVADAPYGNVHTMVYTYVCACMYICMHVCMYVRIIYGKPVDLDAPHSNVCVYVCVCVYIYIYIYIYTCVTDSTCMYRRRTRAGVSDTGSGCKKKGHFATETLMHCA
jgi:hypothetical protein